MKTSATKEGGGLALVPKLRFPEFQAAKDWNDSPIDSILEVRDERRVPSTVTPLFSLTIESGITTKTDRYDREFLVRDAENKKYKLVKPNDIVYNPSNLRWGAINYSQLSHSVVVSPIYEVLSVRDELEHFLEFIARAVMRNEQIKRFITKAQGTLVERIAVKIEDFLSTKLPVPPSLAEQQKIAECLSSVDEVIAAQARKVNALKTHKKGLMQRLFPREGETQPHFRFPEFQNDEEWVEWRLEQLVNLESGGTPSKANPAFWNGSVPWASAKDMKQLFLDDTEDHISIAAVNDGAKLIPSGALLILVRGMTLLKDVPICMVRREMSFNQDVKALRPLDGVDGLFLAWLLTASKYRLLEMVTVAGHGTGKLDTDELKGMALTLPRPAEQRRIASCLSSLDTLITAETQSLDALKRHKRGLMQQLFPSPE